MKLFDEEEYDEKPAGMNWAEYEIFGADGADNWINGN